MIMEGREDSSHPHVLFICADRSGLLSSCASILRTRGGPPTITPFSLLPPAFLLLSRVKKYKKEGRRLWFSIRDFSFEILSPLGGHLHLLILLPLIIHLLLLHVPHLLHLLSLPWSARSEGFGSSRRPALFRRAWKTANNSPPQRFSFPECNLSSLLSSS